MLVNQSGETNRMNGLLPGDTTDGYAAAADGDRKFVVALARGLEVLSAFRARDGLLGNQEIAERTHLPKATVTRLTYTLCELGYLTHIQRLGKYQLAPGAITLGYAALANLGIRHVAREHMDRAAERLGAPVALGVLYRNSALYVDISRGNASFTVQLDIGSRIPLATTAIGRALLVAMPEADRAVLLDQLPEQYGENWRSVADGVAKAMEDYRRSGFVLSRGEWRSDIYAVGAPLVAADGSGIYAFNCGAPPQHFSADRLESEVGPLIANLARVVDATLGGAQGYRAWGGATEPGVVGGGGAQ